MRGLLTLADAVGQLARAVPYTIRAVASHSWLKTEGRVAASQIEACGRDGAEYRPHVVYLYHVDGRAFCGSCIYAGSETAFMGEDRAESYVKRYPKGSSVVVHYNRRRPEASLLEPGVNSSLLLKIVINGLILLFVAYNVWWR